MVMMGRQQQHSRRAFRLLPQGGGGGGGGGPQEDASAAVCDGSSLSEASSSWSTVDERRTSSTALPGLRHSASSEQLQRRGSGTDAWWVDRAGSRRSSSGRASAVTADALELSATLRTLTEAARTQTPSSSPSRRWQRRRRRQAPAPLGGQGLSSEGLAALKLFTGLGTPAPSTNAAGTGVLAAQAQPAAAATAPPARKSGAKKRAKQDESSVVKALVNDVTATNQRMSSILANADLNSDDEDDLAATAGARSRALAQARWKRGFALILGKTPEPLPEPEPEPEPEPKPEAQVQPTLLRDPDVDDDDDGLEHPPVEWTARQLREYGELQLATNGLLESSRHNNGEVREILSRTHNALRLVTQTLLERLTEGSADPRSVNGGDIAAVDIASLSKLVDAVRSAAVQVASQKERLVRSLALVADEAHRTGDELRSYEKQHPKELDEAEQAHRDQIVKWASMDALSLSKAASLASLVAMVQKRSYKIPKEKVTKAMDASNPAQAIAELLVPKLRELAAQFTAAEADRPPVPQTASRRQLTERAKALEELVQKKEAALFERQMQARNAEQGLNAQR